MTEFFSVRPLGAVIAVNIPANRRLVELRVGVIGCGVARFGRVTVTVSGGDRLLFSFSVSVYSLR